VAIVAVPLPLSRGYQLVAQADVNFPLVTASGQDPLMSTSVPPVGCPPPAIAFVPDGHCAIVVALPGVAAKFTEESERTTTALEASDVHTAQVEMFATVAVLFIGYHVVTQPPPIGPLAVASGQEPLMNTSCPPTGPVRRPPPEIAYIPVGHWTVVVRLVGGELKVRVESACTTMASVTMPLQTAQVAVLSDDALLSRGYQACAHVSVAGPFAVAPGHEPDMKVSLVPPVGCPPPPMARVPDGHCATVVATVGVAVKTRLESTSTNCAECPLDDAAGVTLELPDAGPEPAELLAVTEHV
jgi:hypothetical protein